MKNSIYNDEGGLTLEAKQNCIGYEPKGYRDIVWCPYGNEPSFLGVDEDGNTDCRACSGNYEEETHPFICHIIKPR